MVVVHSLVGSTPEEMITTCSNAIWVADTFILGLVNSTISTSFNYLLRL
jgi:hypothetical protein